MRAGAPIALHRAGMAPQGRMDLAVHHGPHVSEAAPPGRGRPLSALRILVADDDADSGSSLAELLRLELGCHVDLAPDGDTAWGEFLVHPPDVMILDVRMPGTGGVELAQRIRAHVPAADAVPLLVAVTGFDPTTVIDEMDGCFAAAFAKPVDLAGLVEMLRRWWLGAKAAQSRFELSTLVSRAVGEALPQFHAAGHRLAFDCTGPFVWVDGDEPGVHAGLYRLLCGLCDLLVDGRAMCRASLGVNAHGDCDFTVTWMSFATLDLDRARAVLARLALEITSPAGAATLQAQGPCPASGAQVTFAGDARQGLRLSFRQLWTPVEVVHPAADAQGRQAWLVGARGFEGPLFARRLQRLGWQVHTFRSWAALRARLRQEAPGAGPDLVLAFGVATCDEALMAFGPDAPAGVPVVVVAPAGADTLRDAGRPGRCHALREPVSPIELSELTRRLASDPVAAPREEDDTLPLPLHAPARVLVVDDLELNRIVATSLLESLGYQADSVADGLDAVDRCRSFAPDVVLMDVNMAVLGGIETTRHMRQLQRVGRLPPFGIIAATTDSSPSTMLECLRVGMDGVLGKPLDRRALRSELNRVVPRTSVLPV
jgi:CheY-like chemotaxis protein